MNKVIGLDLGTNSIGWAIRDSSKKNHQIVDYGVLRFNKGVSDENGREVPSVKQRTQSRGRKKNYRSTKYRKYLLLEFLIKEGMCPLAEDELRKWKSYRKGQKREYPQSKAFLDWIRFDFDGDGKPDFHLFGLKLKESHYAFRAFAVDREEKYRKVFKSNPHILGRILYHLAQRRGFKGRDEEENKTIKEGSEKKGTLGRKAIDSYLAEYKTLGAALYHYQKENGGRIRNRYNFRHDYEKELQEICEVNGISKEDYKVLWKAIIWQHPLRSQKGLVGYCTFETKKRRVQVSHPLYQEYRAWVFINNLKIEPHEGQKKATYLLEKIYPLFIRRSDFTVADILKQVNKDGAKMESKFALEKEQQTKVVALSEFYDFKSVLGEDWKSKYAFEDFYQRDAQPKKKKEKSYTIEDLWDVLITFDGFENLKKFAIEKLKLDEDKADKFSKIKLKKGYASLSLSAVKKLLPYLRKGHLYSHAVYLANLDKVLNGVSISETDVEILVNEIENVKNSLYVIKTLNTITNALIVQHVNEEDRYFIENDRALDSEEKRKIESKAVETFGNKTWDELPAQEKQYRLEYVSKHFRNFLRKPISSPLTFLKQPRLHEEIFKLLQKHHNIPDKNILYLWHPSEQEKYNDAEEFYEIEQAGVKKYVAEKRVENHLARNHTAIQTGRSLKLLGMPEPISKGFKNPMALKTMYRLKWLLNYLLQIGEIDEETKVVVEMARDGKLNDTNRRAAIKDWQQKLERENEKHKKSIREINEESGSSFDEEDKMLIQKVKLWEEQGRRCLYTGKVICLCDALNGNKFDIEHTIPESMSFDNELKNLTLADPHYNRIIKRKQIPSELPNYDNKDVEIDGVLYTAILPRLDFMRRKIESLEKRIKGKVLEAKKASTKEAKDSAIKQRHIAKLELNYWQQKQKTFTIKEYKIGWRNSQLRDTQTITKYALPYLRTVFEKVSVQTGITVNKFKEIYGIKLSEKSKDRDDYAHHFDDAAILTLIPNNYEREKMLQAYHREKESKRRFRTKPLDWENFSSSEIVNLRKKLLVNFMTDHKIFTPFAPSFKKVRKRGKIEKNKTNGKPLLAKGDTVRGQLHTDSFYGVILEKKGGVFEEKIVIPK